MDRDLDMTDESSAANRGSKTPPPRQPPDSAGPSRPETESSVTEPAIDWSQSTAAGADPVPPSDHASVGEGPATSPETSSSSGEDSEQGDHPSGLTIAEVIAEHHAVIYRYALRLCGNAADAEDLCQQTFLTAHRKLHQLRDPGRVRGWLCQILRNAFFKSQRKWQPVDAASLELDVQTVPEEPAGSEEIDQERLQAALGDLAEPFRVVVLMFYFEQASYKEIAAALDLPLGTVMSRLNRAKEHLRARLGG